MKQIRAINLPQLGFSIYRGLLLAMQILQAFEPFKRTEAQPSQINITAHIFEKSLPKAFVAPPGKAATPDTSFIQTLPTRPFLSPWEAYLLSCQGLDTHIWHQQVD